MISGFPPAGALNLLILGAAFRTANPVRSDQPHDHMLVANNFVKMIHSHLHNSASILRWAAEGHGIPGF
jgi:hypothetical protein